MGGRAVKIAEVAAAAGVGVGTVSRVLNCSPQVRDETRERVLEVIERLGYRPSRLASGLALGSTRSVAVLVAFMTIPSVVARLAGILAVLDEEGFDCVVCNIETPEQRDRHLRALADLHRVDGMLVVSIPLVREQLQAISASRMPLVLIDAAAPGTPCVVVDDRAGGELATGHLLGLGHRRIGFIGDTTNRSMGFLSTTRRLDGYRRAHRAAGSEPDPGLVRRHAQAGATAGEIALDLLEMPDPPTAIFAASDTQAAGVLQAADKLGRRVPADLSVVGFDDVETAGLLGLTTVRQPLARSGELGARALCSLIRGEAVSPRRSVLPLELVQRTSTGSPPERSRAPVLELSGTGRPDTPSVGSATRSLRPRTSTSTAHPYWGTPRSIQKEHA